MARLSQAEARGLAARHGIALGCDFHTLPNHEVLRILEVAKARGYRQPRNANGSRARYFHAYLKRAANIT